MAFEYKNRIVRLDLSTGKWDVQKLSEDMFRDYLGGSGVAARILYDETGPEVSPTGPENMLVFMNGLLIGTMVPAACKTSVCAKSPLTGIWCESTAGGHWGSELSRTAYGGIIITGRSREPVYLWIKDDQIEIRSAVSVWGRDTFETDEILRREADSKAKVACIGPAGERLVRISSIMFDGRHARAAGRGGMGAVMGSKNLKAIVVKGSIRRGLADEEGLRSDLKGVIPLIKKGAKGLSDFGTAGGVESVELHGDLPIKNWRLGSWREGARKTSGQGMVRTMFRRHYFCFACPIGCGKLLKITEGPYAGLEGHGPEYETTAGFGALCLNDDAPSIVMANDLCNKYGLDTISTSSSIAFAMEAYEKGIISRSDTDGLELRWGNSEAIVQMVHKIGRKEGIGKILGEGVKRAAEAFGRNSIEFAIHVKGLEHPYHDPRAFIEMAANYATANRGACHLESFSYPLGYGVPLPELGYKGDIDPHSHYGKARMAVVMQNLMSVYNALGLCKFLLRGSIGPAKLSRWTNYAAGWEDTMEELMRKGERIFNLKRAYNVRLGISRKDDVLPPRLLTLDRKEGGAAGSLPHLGRLLGEYYEIRGWSEGGIPSRERLAECGLDDVARDIHRS